MGRLTVWKLCSMQPASGYYPPTTGDLDVALMVSRCFPGTSERRALIETYRNSSAFDRMCDIRKRARCRVWRDADLKRPDVACKSLRNPNEKTLDVFAAKGRRYRYAGRHNAVWHRHHRRRIRELFLLRELEPTAGGGRRGRSRWRQISAWRSGARTHNGRSLCRDERRRAG